MRKRALLVTLAAVTAVAVFASPGAATLQPPPGGGYVGCTYSGTTIVEYQTTVDVKCYSYETAFYAYNSNYPNQPIEGVVTHYYQNSNGNTVYQTRFDSNIFAWKTDGAWHFSLNNSTYPYAKLSYNEPRFSHLYIYPAHTIYEVDQWAY